MGSTYSIEYVRKDPSNVDYAHEWDELPSRFETQEYWGEGKGAFPIGSAFSHLFNEINPDPNKILKFLKINFEYKNQIIDKLNSINEDEYKESYHNRKYYLDLADELFQAIIDNPKFDFYFVWS